MKHKLLRGSVAVIALALCASMLHAQAPKRLALVGGMLLTGYEVPPVHHAAILIEGNRIVAAGPASEIKIPDGATVIDTSGRTMLPGLIETHGHLIVLGHGNYATWFPWINAHGGEAMLRRVMEISARQSLMAGVTTVIDPELKRAFGSDIYAEVQDSLESWSSLGYFQRTDREMFFRERGVKQFIESGAVMGMGTDSGTPMNFHTEALWREIKVHVDMGMSPQRAIAAATRVNAQIIGKGRELGSIEPGKLADIIVVNGNPLFDIVALSRVETVVKDGVVYKGGPSSDAKPRTTSSAR